MPLYGTKRGRKRESDVEGGRVFTRVYAGRHAGSQVHVEAEREREWHSQLEISLRD